MLDFRCSCLPDTVTQATCAEAVTEHGVAAVGDITDLPKPVHLDTDGLVVILVLRVLDQPDPGAGLQEVCPVIMIQARDCDIHLLH